MKKELTLAVYSQIGRLCENNGDNFFFEGKTMEARNRGLSKPYKARHDLSVLPCCAAVFEGLGTEEFGSLAAFAAARTLKEQLEKLKEFVIPEKRFFQDCCEQMNLAVFREARRLETARMGAAVAALLFTESEVYSCNLGHSRTFRLRGGEFLQLSKSRGDADPLQEKTNGAYLGTDPQTHPAQPHIAKGDLCEGDRYLICTDGLTDALSNLEICSIMAEAFTPAGCAARLVKRAVMAEGCGNTTVIVVQA